MTDAEHEAAESARRENARDILVLARDLLMSGYRPMQIFREASDRLGSRRCPQEDDIGLGGCMGAWGMVFAGAARGRGGGLTYEEQSDPDAMLALIERSLAMISPDTGAGSA